jgi:hypothetical protein
MTAMPKAPPTSRAVSLTADPTPARPTGRAAITAPVAGAPTLPMPTPSTTRPAARTQ